MIQSKLALGARAVLVLGFCLATAGTAGFSDPVEPLAWALFLGGLAAVIGGGLLLKAETRRHVEEQHGGTLSQAGLAAGLTDLAGRLSALDGDKAALEPAALCQRIDALLAGPYFELGAHNEDFARVLGPRTFARIWGGFAISERLLARAWSMATDGYLEEARRELPRAREQLALAAREATRT